VIKIGVDIAEQESDYRDDQERKQVQDFKAGNRRFPLSNNVLLMLGNILQPQTNGFNHINLDMSFTNLDVFSLGRVENSSFLINYFVLWGLPKNEYLERGALATHLIARRSLNAKSMDLFTNVTTTSRNEFEDKTDKKTGFARLFGGKKSEDKK